MIIMESQIVNQTDRTEQERGIPPDTKTQKDERHYKYDKQSKAFMLTQNNPESYGLDAETIIDLVHKTFRKNELLYWCMVEEQGTCRHFHIYCLLGKKKRWSSVQRAFPHAHLESEVKGNPQQCRAYLLKEGGKHKDKAETQIEGSFYEEGELPKYFISADRTEMLQQIEEQLDQGMRPDDIMAQSIVFRQYESLIRKQFFARRFKETPPLREVKVAWHLGASGSGKSYSYVKLCEEHSPEEVYYASDYSNACTAMLDTYEAQRILFIDEVKIDSFKYGYLLQLLQGYRTPIHARYCNVYSLWDEVHITSIYTPHDVYLGMVDINNRTIDSEYQLLRRITNYVYHWKTDDGVYHEYAIPASEWVSYDDLVRRATGSDGFTPLDRDSETPFDN